MIKRMTKIGNSSALLLDKALMELVGLKENENVQITINHGSIILTPSNPRPVNMKRFEDILDRVVKERRKVLRRLAE